MRTVATLHWTNPDKKIVLCQVPSDVLIQAIAELQPEKVSFATTKKGKTPKTKAIQESDDRHANLFSGTKK